jgi:predicted lipase
MISLLVTVLNALSVNNNPPMPERPVWNEFGPNVKFTSKLSSDFAPLMQYSVAAYCPSTTRDRVWTCGARCEGDTAGTVLDLSVQDEFLQGAGFVGYQERTKRIIASFRGTSTPQSVIADLDLWKVQADFEYRGLFKRAPDGAKLHRGFQNTYARIRARTQESLKRMAQRFPDYEIVFTGHSLGGSVASIAAVDFHEQNPGNGHRISLYTFGQPRTGNRAWADYIQSLPFASRYYRIVREEDPVPHVPLLSMGYVHAGTHHNLDDRNSTSRCITSGPAGESNDCMTSLFELWFPKHITGYYGWWTYPWFC